MEESLLLIVLPNPFLKAPGEGADAMEADSPPTGDFDG
jgi:hypothetical protein